MSKQTSIELPNTHAENPVGQSVAVKRKRGRPAKQTTVKLDETVETASTSAEHSCGKSSAAKRGRRAQHPTAKTKEIYCLRILLRQDDLNMWVTAFADVAELITGVSVEEFHAFDHVGRKRIAWGVRVLKCNMTIGKTVGAMYTNYTVQIVEFAGYLP